MQCSVVFVLWLGVELVQGGALRCVPGENSACAAEEIERAHPVRMAKAMSGTMIGISRGVYCLVGSEWDSPCGSCRCADSGRAVCQRREGCSATDKELEQQCAPDTMWYNDCNTCWCSEQGRALCTRMGCPYVVQKETQSEKISSKKPAPEAGVDHIERHMVCAARGTFYIGCNTCHCNALGTDYSCTNKPCPLPEDVELFHELRTVKSSNNRSTKQVCVANRMFIKDCNTCWCNEDGTSFFCTRRVCVPELSEPGTEDEPEELRIIKKECRPNEVFELDCNMCRCSPDGKSYSCTRRACVDVDPVVEQVDQLVVEPVIQDAKLLPVIDAVNQTVAGPIVHEKMVIPVDVQVAQPVDQPAAETVVQVAKNQPLVRKSRATEELRKTCQPGQEFRMDCNTCLCDNQGKDFSCTRHNCNTNGGGDLTRSKRETSDSAAENVTMHCVAGSVFNRDCNVCRCADDGEHALCTHRSCVAHAEPDASESEADPNFRCNPGEQLKRGCNDCQCSADGRSVFCTVRFCDQDITPPPPSL